MNLVIEIRAKAERFQELYQTMHALLLTMRKEDGCSASSIYRDIEDEEVFFLAMDWDDAAKFEKFMRSVSGSALLGAFNTLSQTVRVRVGENPEWRGIEVLKRP
jgi:quinol monooxygenase YgiN